MVENFTLSIQFPSQLRVEDWHPMERHPRPLKRRNPNDMGFQRAFDAVVGLY